MDDHGLSRRKVVRSGAAMAGAALAATFAAPAVADAAAQDALLGTDGTVGGPGGSPLSSTVLTGNPPAWQPNTAYDAGAVVAQNGEIFAAQAAFTSAATWLTDFGNWTALGGTSQPNLRGALTTGATAGAALVTTTLTKLLEIPVPNLNPGGPGSASAQPLPAVSNPLASSFIVIAQMQLLTASGPLADIGIQFNIRSAATDAILSMFAFWGIASPTQYDVPYTFLWPYIPYSGGPGGAGSSGISDLGTGSGYKISLDAYTVGTGSKAYLCNNFLAALAGSFFAPAGTLLAGVSSLATAGSLGEL